MKKPSHSLYRDTSSSDLFFERKYSNLKDALKVETDSDLARKLGITQQSVQGAKRRKRIPSRWLKIIYENYGITSDMVMSIAGTIRDIPELRGFCDKHQWASVSVEGIRRSIVKGYEPKLRNCLELALLLVIKDAVSDLNIGLSATSLTYVEYLFKYMIEELKSTIMIALKGLPPDVSIGKNEEVR